MGKKVFMRFLSTVICLVLLCSMTVFAEEEYVYDDESQFKYVEDIDEYLEQLNAGLVVPLDTTITTFYPAVEGNEQCASVSPMSWPWTDCSNILGHSWGSWGFWTETYRNHQPTAEYCLVLVQRKRHCQRTYCNATDIEKEVVAIKCCQ